ncbi:MAG: ATP phosphoribosyltransferase [Dehalococcoidia bacterium]|nr:ATP phosphoribosyltransferase [Dehalococcoidia bacterium]MQG09575.1 ATP phosphoribosyltransferase [SAR202 cluster bacterium]
MSNLRLAIPSTGALYEDSINFLQKKNLEINRLNSRKYTANIPSLKNISVLFQRQSDITMELDNDSADIGIVGLDRYFESRLEKGNLEIMDKNLGFGHAKLVIAIPDSWIDVNSMFDLADISLEFRKKGRNMRIATKYPRLVNRFLRTNDVNFIDIVHISGGLEAAPIMGYADIIADITATGTTLKENDLRIIDDGIVIESQAVMICNYASILIDDEKINLFSTLYERVTNKSAKVFVDNIRKYKTL